MRVSEVSIYIISISVTKLMNYTSSKYNIYRYILQLQIYLPVSRNRSNKRRMFEVLQDRYLCASVHLVYDIVNCLIKNVYATQLISSFIMFANHTLTHCGIRTLQCQRPRAYQKSRHQAKAVPLYSQLNDSSEYIICKIYSFIQINVADETQTKVTLCDENITHGSSQFKGSLVHAIAAHGG